MIFVTVGTEKFPFDRLVRAIDLAVESGRIRESVFIQKGCSSYVPRYVEYSDFLSFLDMTKMIKKSRLVVSHAGVGTHLLCTHLGKVPILFPRRADLGEHLDDHQFELAEIMETLDRALVAYDEEELFRKIDMYPFLVGRVKLRGVSQKDRLIAYLDEVVKGLHR